jgi:hypothetical protein
MGKLPTTTLMLIKILIIIGVTKKNNSLSLSLSIHLSHSCDRLFGEKKSSFFLMMKEIFLFRIKTI